MRTPNALTLTLTQAAAADRAAGEDAAVGLVSDFSDYAAALTAVTKHAAAGGRLPTMLAEDRWQ